MSAPPSRGERVTVSGMGGGLAEIVRMREKGIARVRMLASGKERSIAVDRLVRSAKPGPKRARGAAVMEPITSSAEISGVIPEGPVARAMRGRSEPAARVRQRQPPLECEKFLAWVRKMPCAHCGSGIGVEPHHWSHEGGIMGDKVDDYRVVPLCRCCHYDEWHAHGTLPGLDRVASEAFFVAEQLKLVSEWLVMLAKKRPENVLDALVGALRELSA